MIPIITVVLPCNASKWLFDLVRFIMAGRLADKAQVIVSIGPAEGVAVNIQGGLFDNIESLELLEEYARDIIRAILSNKVLYN